MASNFLNLSGLFCHTLIHHNTFNPNTNGRLLWQDIVKVGTALGFGVTPSSTSSNGAIRITCLKVVNPHAAVNSQSVQPSQVRLSFRVLKDSGSSGLWGDGNQYYLASGQSVTIIDADNPFYLTHTDNEILQYTWNTFPTADLGQSTATRGLYAPSVTVSYQRIMS